MLPPTRLLLPVAGLLLGAACDAYRSDRRGDDPHDETDPHTDATLPFESDDHTGFERLLAVEVLDQPFRVEVGQAARIEGRVRSQAVPDVEGLEIVVVSEIDGEVGTAVTARKGRFTVDVDGLSPGAHVLAIEAREPASGARGRTKARLSVCEWPARQTFDGNPIGQGWQAFGDATWDPAGWMEITGNAQSRAGSVYQTSRKIDPGDFRLEFRIATGGGINTGADGYAVNIVNVDTVEDLAAYVDMAWNGGCLGYGVSGNCGTGTVDAFHVEFDTWQNKADPITDPTPENHVAITFDGDPGVHELWAPIFLEDLKWRQVVVEAQGETVRVELDGQTLVTRTIPGFRFDGGWIGVSGSTGWASNYHRFDDLRILDRCEVPDR